MRSKSIIKKLFSIMFIIVTILGLTSCKKKLDDTPLQNMEVVADFLTGKQKSFFPSDGWCNGEPFNVTWSGQNVSYEQGAAKLFITEEDGKYYGAELRSAGHFWYGDYEVTMKPDPTKGTCSSFFIYTGPSEMDENGNPNPHDEIDIEFLGKDTTHVQFNFFVNGKGGNEYKYDLGFDASEEYHTYGFRWTENYITWYVDGQPVYRVDATSKKPIPQTPGRIMVNYWCGTKQAELWMGKYSHPSNPDGSYYALIKSSCEPKLPEGTVNNFDWDDISPLENLSAVGDSKHTITTSGKDYNVVYNGNVGATYTNVKFELENHAVNKNYLYLTATNNSDQAASIRVDVFGDATRKTQNNQYVCNVAATMDGVEAPTDLNWGGSSFNNIPAGATVELIIYYEGIASSLQIMFHTHIYGDTATHSGDITISNIKFAALGELKLPEGNSGSEVTAPTISINGADKSFTGNLDTYTLSTNDNKLTIDYVNVTGNCYHNINTQINDIASDKEEVTLVITNNGSASVKIRVDVDSSTKVNETTACNISATMNGSSVYTDTEWGGSVFEIPAGATVTCVVKFDNTRTVTMLMLFIDSSQYEDTNTYTGNVTISSILFK